jgi:hypothetical protein
MIRPLRRRHRWTIPTLLLLLAIAAVLALANPAPSADVDALPALIVAAEGSPNSR